MIISIPKRLLLSKLRIKIIANPNCQKMLDKGQAMKNGDILQITPEIKLEAVPAYNTTR